MITLIVAEKACDKIHHPFMIFKRKTLNELGMDWNFSQSDKVICGVMGDKKLAANNRCNGQRMNASPSLSSRVTWICTFTTAILAILISIIRQENEIKGTQMVIKKVI
jgi:hypothetical protein